MKKLPEIVSKAWANKKGAIVFSTTSKDGKPNAIYATCVSNFKNEQILVANNFFHKTIKNIDAGSTGSILFLTNDDKSYQIKGKIDYYTEGIYFEEMKKWNPKHLPGHGVAVLHVEQVYAGGEQLI